MSKTRLNLSLDQDLVDFVKALAKEQRTTVATIFQQYLLNLKRQVEGDPTRLILADPVFRAAMDATLVSLRSGTAKWHSFDDVFNDHEVGDLAGICGLVLSSLTTAVQIRYRSLVERTEMLHYRKGNQKETLDSLPLQKIDLVMDGDIEGIWVRQGKDYVVLQNAALHFYPFPSWGVVFASKNPPGDRRETIDISQLKPAEGLELHPEAWRHYLKRGTIDAEGCYIAARQEASP